MKKKILSLILSMVLIVGAMPAMNMLTVSAAGGTDFFALEDFENYTLGEKSVTASEVVETQIADKDGASRIAVRQALKTSIESGVGYDGNTTQYLKVEVPTRTTDNNAGRMFLNPHTSSVTYSGKYVYEFKFKGTATHFTFNPFTSDSATGAYLFSGQTIGLRSLWNDWVSVRVVVDASTDKFLVYMNDALVLYNEGSKTDDKFTNAYFNFKYCNGGTYLYIDDIRLYHTPDATVATAAQKDATDVARTVNPTVTFNESLLDRIANSDATVTITDKTNGGTVAVENLAVSADGKTLTIDPATDLAYGAQYEIKLNNFRDVFDAGITGDTTFTFTTMSEPKYEVTAPVFKKHNLFEGTSNAITQLENGSISCTYSITNNESEAKPICFLAVLYENNELKQFLFKEEMLAQGATSTFSGGFTVGDAANSRIQTFIWNSLSDMGALGSSYTLDTAGLR